MRITTNGKITDSFHVLGHAAEYVRWVERFLSQEHGDLNRVVERVKMEEWEGKPLPRQPEKSYLLNTGSACGLSSSEWKVSGVQAK